MSCSTRRVFLRQSAVLGIGLTTGTVAKAVAANDKISVACIGVRGRGNSVMNSFAAEPDCAVTHICDVNASTRDQRAAEMKEKTGLLPTTVSDYRTLLDDRSVDAFMVATPDHWHTLPTIHGCMAGKDVYVEKPASHNIVEGKTAVAAAHKHDRMVQMGTQIRSAPFLREATAYVESGALGRVIFGRAWETSRNGVVHLPPDSAPPAELDYHLWQGPAPERPYNRSIVGGAWRWLFDYGTGDLGQTQQAHIRNFLDAVRSRKRDSLNQEIRSGHISTAMCHAGNISWRTDKKLRFDAETETFDDKDANQFLGREHRTGFELPDVT